MFDRDVRQIPHGRYGRVALVALGALATLALAAVVLAGALGAGAGAGGATGGTEMSCAKAASQAMSVELWGPFGGHRMGCIAGGYSWGGGGQVPI